MKEAAHSDAKIHIRLDANSVFMKEAAHSDAKIHIWMLTLFS